MCLSEPPSIMEGVFVWCKFRQYPFWPAWVSAKHVDEGFFSGTKLLDGQKHNVSEILEVVSVFV